MKWTTEKKLVLLCAFVLIAFILNFMVTYRANQTLIKNDKRVSHTHQVLTEIHTLLSTLLDAETGQRGFVITGKEEYLEPYHGALKRLQEETVHLKTLTADNPVQQRNISLIESLVAVKLNELDQAIVLRQQSGFDAARQAMLSGRGKQAMDEIRRILANMNDEENGLLARRGQESEAAGRIAIMTAMIESVIDIVLLALVVSLAYRGLAERKRSAAALYEQREQLRVMLSSIGDAVIATDLHGRISFMNTASESLTGWMMQEAKGKPLDDVFNIINGYTRRPAESPVIRVIREGVMVELANHTVLIAKDGTERPIDDIAAPIRKDGSLLGVILVFRDVTERQRAEETKSWLAAVVDSSDDAIISKNLDGIITSWNPGAERIFGYTAAETIGRPIGMIVPEERQAEELGFLAQLRDGKHIEHFETERLNKAGRRYSVSLTVSPVKNAEGQFSGVSEVARDITERKQAEEDRIRTAQLESIGMLAGGIAHDFNNLLMTVIGNISLAKMALDPRARPYDQLSSAQKATIRAGELTQQLLTFSKGGKPIMKTMSLAPLIAEFTNFALQGSNIQCEFQIADDLWPVEADEGQIGQVTNNLVLNARQAMPRGGAIRIAAANHQGPPVGQIPFQGDFVQITVTDQGTGIPKDYLTKVFEPFFTTKSTGSGLGLTTAYSIIKQHGGTITVESSPGAGTTFSILLPRSPHVIEVPESPVSPVRGEGRILVMDDDDAIRQTVQEMLLALGYEVDCVSDGAQAVERYRSALHSARRYDAVILDLTVRGGLGGKESIGPLHEIDPHVRAIVSSGYSNDSILADFRQFGFSGRISKPFTLQNLSQVLAAVLSS
jgi:PAS domain S-box-containing protein